MQSLSYLKATALSPAAIGLGGTVVAMILVWYLGPLFPGLNAMLPRIAIIITLAVTAAVAIVIQARQKRQREQALAAGVVATDTTKPSSNGTEEAIEEVAQLRARMSAALARLRRSGRRWGYLYEQPWFLLIGPPGSGKTTALANSGLRFPLTSDDNGPVPGVGGTRLCDWWFADEAVLIDTAGRYTTQDSDAAVDRAGWHGFLDMLRRTRTRQPINGVIVVVSVTDIAAAPEEERMAHAKAIRRRVKEVSDRLNIEVPVYMVFSKADQLRGFNEYFSDLDAEGRRQVWGMTFPLTEGVEAFAREFQLLLDALDSRQLDRLQAERAPDRRAMAAGFPLQAASAAKPLEQFLRQTFGGSRLDPAPLLRGIYFSSATQQGTPLDQLTGLLARSFGIDQQRAPSLRPVAGRSYFLHRLLHDVVLGEALLASTRSQGARRRRLLRLGGFSVVGALTLLGLLILGWTDGSSHAAVLRTETALGAYRSQLAALPLDPVANDDLTKVTPVLDAAAALPADADGFITIPGLSQGGKLKQSTAQAYREALRTVLLPRLVWRLENEMRARFNDGDFLYQATRVYLMLGGEGPLDPALVRNWEAQDWDARFPGALNAGLRDHLNRHLDALLREPLPPVTLDGALVGAARATFSRVPLAARVYGRIRGDAATAEVPDWNPAQVLGQGGAPLFIRKSGAPLTQGIPGFYTSEGFRTVLLDRLAATTRSVIDEKWVLGKADASSPQDAAPDALEHAVVGLWIQDAEAHWDTLLGDLVLAPLGDRNEAVKRLYLLSSPQSPMRDLLASVVTQLTLRSPPPADKSKPPPADPIADSADTAIGQHYSALRALLTQTGQEAPIAGLLRLINALQSDLSRNTTSGPDTGADPQGSGTPASALQAEADRQPVPVGPWLHQIAATGHTILGSNAADAAATSYASSSGPAPLCRQVVERHYPFDPAARADAPLTDFARLFAPNGALDSYFQSQIKPFADTSGPVWKVHAAGDTAPPVDGSALASFQRAAAIRDAFFPVGGGAQVRFSVAPQPSDSSGKATLTIGAVHIDSDVQSTSPIALTWPQSGGAEEAGMMFTSANSLQETGSWALFRLLAHAQTIPSGPSSFTAVFQSGNQSARFAVRADSSRNPFDRHLLEGFRCPVIR